jgi:hypothetical protein
MARKQNPSGSTKHLETADSASGACVAKNTRLL